MAPTIPVPNLLTDPGVLLQAPGGSALPADTVVGSKFTDAWPAAWRVCGATEDGSEFTYATKVEPISVAEFFDPIRWATTERNGSFSFVLMDWTLRNWQFALNSSTSPLIVSGTGTTQLNELTPPAAGSEARVMLGWESSDSTVRVICYQTINGAEIKSKFGKAPAKAGIATEFRFEIPTSPTYPFRIRTAGTTRA